MYLLRGFKFTIGLNPSDFFGTQRKEQTNPFDPSVTSVIAFLSKSLEKKLRLIKKNNFIELDFMINQEKISECHIDLNFLLNFK